MTEDIHEKQQTLDGEEVGRQFKISIKETMTEDSNAEGAHKVTRAENETRHYRVRAQGWERALDSAIALHPEVSEGVTLTIKVQEG